MAPRVERQPLDQDDPEDNVDDRPPGWPFSVLALALLVGVAQVLWLCGVV
jgi:hypothetical protein